MHRLPRPEHPGALCWPFQVVSLSWRSLHPGWIVIHISAPAVHRRVYHTRVERYASVEIHPDRTRTPLPVQLGGPECSISESRSNLLQPLVDDDLELFGRYTLASHAYKNR